MKIYEDFSQQAKDAIEIFNKNFQEFWDKYCRYIYMSKYCNLEISSGLGLIVLRTWLGCNNCPPSELMEVIEYLASKDYFKPFEEIK